MTPLDAALDYAARGWRVLPIIPGEKRPPLTAWQEQATTDPQLVKLWWSTTFPDYGVGIATGQRSGLWVLDIDTGPGKNGDDTLADLEAEHGPLPDTVEVLTGSGGRHLYFAWPDGVEIRNDQAGRLGPGLDVRGEGGQVLAPPTLHPSGPAYDWEASSHPDDTPLAQAPQWLIDLLTVDTSDRAKMRRDRPTVAYDGPPRPGDTFAANITWPELLEADGATYLGTRTERTSGEPYELWSRPPMPGERDFTPHTSATLYYKGSDVLKVFTSSWMGADPATGEVWRLTQDETYTRFGYYAARHFGGDHAAAAASLRSVQDTTDIADLLSTLGDAPEPALPEADHGWRQTDVGAVLADDYDPPRPELLHLADGDALLYRGRVNTLFGESGGGKSWIAMLAAAQVIADGGRALYIDFEDYAPAVLNRMIALGCDRDALTWRFRYVNPVAPWNLDAAEYLAELIRTDACDLVVIDSTGEALANDAVKDQDDEVARWFRKVPRYLADLGPAVLLIDHVPKNVEGHAKGPIGSQRKKAAVSGIALELQTKVSPARGVEGHLAIVCQKDRGGAYQSGKVLANITVKPSFDRPDGVDIVIDRRTGPERPTTNMARISEFLELEGPSSARQIREALGLSGGNVKAAISALVDGEFVRAEPRSGRGGGVTFVSSQPFRNDGSDLLPVDNSGSGTTGTAPGQTGTSPNRSQFGTGTTGTNPPLGGWSEVPVPEPGAVQEPKPVDNSSPDVHLDFLGLDADPTPDTETAA